MPRVSPGERTPVTARGALCSSHRLFLVAYRVSERRACEASALPRGTHRCRSMADEQEALRMRLRGHGPDPGELRLPASSCPPSARGLGGRSQEGLSAISPGGVDTEAQETQEAHIVLDMYGAAGRASGADESWSTDFMSDELFDGRRIRLLTIVDNFTRESLAVKEAASIGGQGVVELLHQLMRQHRMPKTIRVDNGLEFISKRLDQWALPERSGVRLQPAGEAWSALVCSPKTEPVIMRVLWDDLNRLERRIVP